MFIIFCKKMKILIDVSVRKKQSVSDKLIDYTLKNAEHLHFLCTGMLDIYFIKKYKNKIQKLHPQSRIIV